MFQIRMLNCLNSKGKLDVAGAVGTDGFDSDEGLRVKEPYIGQTPIVTGEIAEDVTVLCNK